MHFVLPMMSYPLMWSHLSTVGRSKWEYLTSIMGWCLGMRMVYLLTIKKLLIGDKMCLFPKRHHRNGNQLWVHLLLQRIKSLVFIYLNARSSNWDFVWLLPNDLTRRDIIRPSTHHDIIGHINTFTLIASHEVPERNYTYHMYKINKNYKVTKAI